MANLKMKPATRRDAADTVRLKAAGDPAHINAHEARLLQRVMPEAAGPVVTKGLLAEAGRRGDDRVTKLIPAEAALLRSRGGSGTVNPATGLLEFEDDAGNGNPGGGHNADGGASSGGYGGGVSSSPGDGGSYGTGYGPPDPFEGSLFGRALPEITPSPTLGYRAYDPATMPSIESLLGAPNNYRDPNYEDLSMIQYSPPDTFGRLFDTYRYGPPPSYQMRGQVPGQYGIPNELGPGFARKAVSTLAGPIGPALSVAMNLGMHMDQAMSPETRTASLAENQAQGTKNSTGQDRADPGSGMSVADMAAAMPGARSGAETAALTPPPGYTTNPAGQIIPLPRGNSRNNPLRDPIRNWLADYIMNGRGWA